MSDDNEVQGRDPLDDDSDIGDDALFQRIKTWHKLSRDHLAEWREQAREDYGFVSGDQWSDEDKQSLLEQKRPLVTFNRIGPVIDSVAGMEVGNRQEVRYLPRQVENSGFNEMLSNAAKFFRDESEAEDEESDAFFDTIVCGLGATETRPDFDDDPDGLVPIDRLDPMSLWYDPSARKRNLTDRRYCGYDKELSLDDAKAMFPDVEDEDDLDAGWARPDLADDRSPHDATPQIAYNQGNQTRNEQQKKITVVYCEWWDREEYHLAVNPLNGEKIEMDAATAAALDRRVGQMKKLYQKFNMDLPPQVANFHTVQLSRKVYKNAFLGKRVLKSGPGRCPHDFTICFITGKRDRNENTFYGLVRAMKDPQRWANKFFSQIMHVINSNAKGGVLAEKDAFENPRKAEDDWARSDAVIWATPGALAKGKIQPRAPITYPAGLDKMMEYSISAIRDTTGVNLEMLGMADREQAGVLEYQRKKAGIAILGSLFDSLRRYRKQQGKALLYIIQSYIPEQRLIRIDTDNGPQYAPLLKDPSNTEYDVIVDDAPTSPDQKEAVWGMVTQMLPFLTKTPLPPSIWAEIVKYSPLPNSLAIKVGQALQAPPPQQQPLPPEVQQHIEQLTDQLTALQKQLQQAEMDKAQLKMQGDAKVIEAQGTMRIEASRALHQQELDAAEMRLKQAIAEKEMEIQAQRAALDIQIRNAATEADLQRQQREAQFDEAREQAQMAFEREKAERSHELEKTKFERSHKLDREKAQADDIRRGPRKKTVKLKKAGNKTTGAEVTNEDGSVVHIDLE